MSSCSDTAWRRSGASNPLLLDLAYDLDLPIVATNEPYFATAARTSRRMTR